MEKQAKKRLYSKGQRQRERVTAARSPRKDSRTTCPYWEGEFITSGDFGQRTSPLRCNPARKALVKRRGMASKERSAPEALT